MNQKLKEIVDSLHCQPHKQGKSVQKVQEQELHNAQDQAPNFLKDNSVKKIKESVHFELISMELVKD